MAKKKTALMSFSCSCGAAIQSEAGNAAALAAGWVGSPSGDHWTWECKSCWEARVNQACGADTDGTDSLPEIYSSFLDRKTQLGGDHGFAPVEIPAFLFPFQRHLVEWAVRRGRAALFADTGLGKTAMQLAWADNVVRHMNGRVLILTPLAVGAQTVAEADRFGIGAVRSRDGAIGGPGIYVTNYEQLHRFDSKDFVGIVCDESSILKHFTGATQKAVTRFASKVPCRLLCTATAAPNDYIELGSSSEALGELGATDMLAQFFMFDEGKHGSRIEDVKAARAANAIGKGGRDSDTTLFSPTRGGNHFGKLAYRVSQDIAKWRLKGHAEEPFWRWVASWARACRKPSDVGFPDDGYELQPMVETMHIVKARTLAPGLLFSRPAFGLQEEREERRRTLAERVETVAKLVDHKKLAVVWCHMNAEGDALEAAIPGSVQVAGRHSEQAKEDNLLAFARGDIRVLITKAKIAGFGLNLQKCAHVVTFATHSYEQHYQAVRRCWRYGQKSQVHVDVVSTEGEVGVVENMQRKARAASRMFDALVRHMGSAQTINRSIYQSLKVEAPSWLTEA